MPPPDPPRAAVTSVLRLAALREKLRASLWLWPAVAVTAAILLGIILPSIEHGGDGDSLGFAGTPDGARSVLATVAGSMITVTGLTFSLTVVALQMASTQFTPRILATFLADRGNQAVLSSFLATFAYSLAVLRSVRSAPEDGEPFVPDLAVTLGLVLTLVSVGMLVYFFHHLTQQLRVESILGEVRGVTTALIRKTMADRDPGVATTLEVPPSALPLEVRRTGYLQALEESVLQRVACEEGVAIHLRPSVGIYLTAGSTIAWAWPAGHDPTAQLDAEALASRLHSGLQIGPERTMQQDVAFGIRQLVDIAARALSPGINDPTTAVTVLHSLSSVLAELCGCRMGDRVLTADEGDPPVLVPGWTFGELLALACDQPRRYGKDEPAVLTELIRMLTDLAEVATAEAERDAIRDQIEVTVETAQDAELSTAEQCLLTELARHARAAVDDGARSAEVPEEDERPAS